jgi:hypothetical protein
MAKLTLQIEHDQDVDSPCNDDCQWKLVSFNRRHLSHGDPSQFFDEHDNLKIGIRRKLDVGLAFWLDYYEHGLCRWSLSGSGPQCQWDTSSHAGILLWEHDPSEIGAKSYQDRAKDAKNFLEVYTDWANGNCYWVQLIHEDGMELDSCGGFIGKDHLVDAVKDMIGKDDEIDVITGEYSWVADPKDFK